MEDSKILDICQGATGKEESQFKKNLESKLYRVDRNYGRNNSVFRQHF